MPKRTRATKTAKRPNVLVSNPKPKETCKAAAAAMMVEGLGMNTVAAVDYSKALGELHLTECMVAMAQIAQRVQAGHLDDLESVLTAQAVALNAMFTQLAHQASAMTIVDQIDRFTRLALKAQAQCRATVETLALLKNPPAAVFARQANIAHGPQQVNNSAARPPGSSEETSRAGNRESEQSRLLEAHGERLDSGAAGTAARGHQTVAPVGTVHRSAHS